MSKISFSHFIQYCIAICLFLFAQSAWSCTTSSAIKTTLSTPSVSPSSVSRNGSFTVYKNSGQSLCGSGLSTDSNSKSYSNKSNGIYSYYSFTPAQTNSLPYLCYQHNWPENYCYAYKSNSKSITVVRTPGAPGAVEYGTSFLSCTTSSISFSWAYDPSANRYDIQERRRAKIGVDLYSNWEVWATIKANHTTTSYTRDGIEEGYDYQYRVQSKYYLNGHYSNASGWGAVSTESRYKPWCAPDASSTPDSITAGPAISYDGEANLIWDNTKPAYGAGFHYEVRTVNDNVIRYQGTANVIDLTELDNGVNTFEVTACNVDGCNTAAGLPQDSIEVIIAPEPPAEPNSLVLPMQQPLEAVGGIYNGSLSGSFDVNASGAATYAVPIAIPPGTAGIAPTLSLNYSNQSGSGIAGLGWSLSGLSTIHRCPQTLVQDGNTHAVNYTSDDRFCLDSQRLVAINSGDYGANGTEYRTEIDSFSKITSNGTAGTGPASFTVETKTGETLYYGTTADSAVEAQGSSTIAAWALARVNDSSTNYYTITYDENTSTGEYVVDQMQYTGNTNAGVLPYQIIRFEYETRPDTRSGYRAGSLVTSSKRLTNIVTAIGEYKLSYKAHTTLQPSRLDNIEYCDASGNLCREPIAFTWSGDDNSGGWDQDNAFAPPFPFVNAEGSQIGSEIGSHLTDLNADGFIDIAKRASEGQINQNRFGSANGWSTTSELTLPISTIFNNAVFIDVDADGDTDFLMVTGNDNGYAWLQQDGTWVSAREDYGPPKKFTDAGKDAGTRLVDLNGDGLIDLIHSRSGVRQAWINSGTGWQSAPANQVPDFGADFANDVADTGVRMLDLNSDGFQDIVNGALTCTMIYGPFPDSSSDDYETCNPLVNVRLGSPNGWVEAPGYTPPSEFRKTVSNAGLNNISDTGARFADLNGDGLPDFVQGSNAWLNTGVGWVSAPEYGLSINIVDGSGDDNGWRFYDLNGDGRQDLISENSALYHNGNAWVSFSAYTPPSGMGAFTKLHPQDASIQVDSGLRILDINSDGFVDIVLGAYSTQRTWLNTRIHPQISAITTDTNKVIDIEYRSQLDASVYSEDDTQLPVPGVRKVNGPLQLVYEVSTPNGLVTSNVMEQRSTRYAYKGLVIHTQGLGSLGFSEVRQTDTLTGQYSITRYNQAYPYLGLPVSTQSFTGNDVLLSEMTAITFEDIQTQASNSCVRTGMVSVTNTDCTATDIAVPVLPYISKKEEIIYHLNDDLTVSLGSTKTITDTVYDEDGNPTMITVAVTGTGSADSSEYKTITLNNYNDGINTPQCHLGLLKDTTVTTSRDGQSDAYSVRTTAFEYDPTSCLLTKDIIEPNAGVDIRLETTYQHDNFGNVIQMIATNGVQSRVMSTSYNSADYTVGNLSFNEDGRFPVKVTNALGHSEYHAFDPDFGLETRMTGPNGLATCWDYDDLGRKILERQLCDSTIETQTRIAYHHADLATTGLGQASTVVVTQSSGSSEVLPESRVYLDHVGREIRRVGYSFTDDGSGAGSHMWLGQLVFTDTVYDEFGNTTHTSAPYYGYSNAPAYWNVTTYDYLDRVQSLSTPLGVLEDDGSTQSTGLTTMNYLGFAIEVTDAKGRVKREEKNANGQLSRVVQAQGSADETTLDYSYTLAGELNTTQIVGRPETMVTLGYDVLSRKTSMSDPDMGNWSYQYNAFGDLIQQTDAKGQVTNMSYDDLGRLASRTDKDDTGNTVQTSNWEYYGLGDPAGSIGKLKQESADNQTSTSYTYDSYGRQSSMTQNTLGSTLVSSQTYDSLGRVQSITYPAVGSAPAYTIQRHYNHLGLLWYITGPDNTVYWIADAIDERGQLEEARNHNATEDFRDYDPASGWLKYTDTYNVFNDTQDLDQLIQLTRYSFDEVGNVMTRNSRLAKDGGASLTPTSIETFTYDALDRITSAQVKRPDDVPVYDHTKNYTQDVLGNITYKSDVGYYRYGAECSSNAAGPHAVCEVVDSGGSTLRSYQYDLNGNMTWGGVIGMERNITFSTFNKPTIITQGANETRFTYGASRSRVYRYSTDGNENKTTYYLGLGKTNSPLYELETNTTTDIETHLHFIYAGNYHGGHPFMMHVVKRDAIDEVISEGQEYMHRDHLWSVIAISDHTGQVISPSDPNKQYAYNKSYDAWGKRRNPDWTEGEEDQYTTDRGHLCYTGQESITNVGLIHMNGRVYDPELGRFISADPHIQFIANSQSYNRYSYVLNNPLKYTDPTGYFLKKLLRNAPRIAAYGLLGHAGWEKSWDQQKEVLQEIPGNMAGFIGTALNFIPVVGTFASIAFNFAYAMANGGSLGRAIFSAGIGYIGGQVGLGIQNAALRGAVVGAFNGGITAAVSGGNIRRGIVQGATFGAVYAAVVYGIQNSVSNRVTQKSRGSNSPRKPLPEEPTAVDSSAKANAARKALLGQPGDAATLDKEYGGYILKNKDRITTGIKSGIGKYAEGAAGAGNVDLGSIPENAVGDFHGHGGLSSGSEWPSGSEFSVSPGSGDVNSAIKIAEQAWHQGYHGTWDSYVGTPGNRFWRIRVYGDLGVHTVDYLGPLDPSKPVISFKP